MSTKSFPASPFSTRLSGSAKETELRLRSIFQWKKQRPPVWLMLLTAAICLSCGSLVSCQVEEQPSASQQQEGQAALPAGQQHGHTGFLPQHGVHAPSY